MLCRGPPLHGRCRLRPRGPERIRDYRQATFRIDTSNPAELQTLEAVEQQYIQRVLKSVQGNRTEAARILGVDRKTLYRRLKQDEESQG